jgi:hypothetical protein
MLIGNRSVLHKSPGRFLAGTVASTDQSGWCKPGMMRSAAYPALAGLPNGYYDGAWFLPKTAGALSSAYNARIDLAGAALLVGGVTSPGEATLTLTPAATAWPLDDSVQIRTASASITFTVADAAGQLISSGSGSASMAFSTNTPLLTASLAAVGSTSFALSASGAMGAEASGEGAASMTFSMAATILPTVDTPPARTATANFAITGALVPYAIGQMVGSTVDTSILTVDAIAAGVLAAALTSPIAANIRRVNDVTVTGTGEVGSEWGPA